MSSVHPSTWLESLGDNSALGMMARLPPIMALRLRLEESSTMPRDHTHTGVEASEVVRGSLTDGGCGAATSLEGHGLVTHY